MMKRILIYLLSACFILSGSAMIASAMDHGQMEHHDGMKMENHEGHDHSMHEGMEHGSGMMGSMQMLGQTSSDGVKAMAHIKTYDEGARAQMAKMGMAGTHHFMVMFADEASGKPIKEGMVAVKVVDADGNSDKTVKLMKMGDGFGADIEVPGKGMYTIKVGTKLADGQKRQFSFELHNM